MISAADQRSEELRALATRMLNLANAIDGKPSIERERPADDAYRGWDGVDVEWMLTKAYEIYRFRRRRQRFFNPELFGEPAWDMLLDLFIARLKNDRISVTSACRAADVPSTTALRWLRLLEDANLIERLSNLTDQRVTWVRLTDHGANSMSDTMRDLFSNLQKSVRDDGEYLITRSNLGPIS